MRNRIVKKSISFLMALVLGLSLIETETRAETNQFDDDIEMVAVEEDIFLTVEDNIIDEFTVDNESSNENINIADYESLPNETLDEVSENEIVQDTYSDVEETEEDVYDETVYDSNENEEAENVGELYDAETEQDGQEILLAEDEFIYAGDLPTIEHIEYDSILDYGDDANDGIGLLSLDGINEDGVTYAAKYIPDLSDLPTLRNQGTTQTCWAHSSIFMAEESMLKKGLADRGVNYSELALAYFMTHTVEDPLGLTNGDINKDGNSSNGVLHNFLTGGGNIHYSSILLSNWVGATDDSGEASFSNRDSVQESGMSSQYAFSMNEAVLTGYRVADIATHSVTKTDDYYTDEYILTNREAIKELILANGAVGASFYSLGSTSAFYNSDNNAYYYPTPSGTNHAVSIVGWDDNFSKDNFKVNMAGTYPVPKGDGAWLIRNSSYNSGHLEQYGGYLWISYYDLSLRNSRAFIFDSATSYDNNYHYDGGVGTSYLQGSNYIKAANVFTAKASFAGEYLKTVSFDTSSSNLNYEISVYLNPDADNPESGQLISDATVTGTTNYAGYYTIPLRKDVHLSSGDTFATVVKLTKQGAKPNIGREYPLSGYIDSTVSANSGESYIYSGGKWVDAGVQYGANIRIKAFTVNANDTFIIRYEPNGGTGSAYDDYCGVSAVSVIKENTFSRSGYVFNGWNTEIDGSGTAYSEGSLAEFYASHDDVITLYAQWKISPGWTKYSGGYRYILEDGTYPVDKWMKIGGYWYRFNSNGFRLTSWQKIGSSWYHMTADGKMQTGWQKIGGYWYHFATNGVKQTKWQKIGDNWYYLGTDGVLRTSWQKIGGYWYHFSSKGILDRGWNKVGGNWYHFASNGIMQTGWQSIGNNWYYLGSKGIMQKDWVFTGGYWYYLGSKGIMQTGWILWNDKYYYCYSNGKMATNTWIGKYYVDSNGVWTKTR